MVDLKTKEEFIKNIKEFIAENRYGLKFIGVIGVFLCFGVPLIVNYAYIFGESQALFITAWDAADMLSFYGTLLGATATITAVYATIKFSRESAEKDRNHSEKINHENKVIEAGLELIDSLDYQLVAVEILSDFFIKTYASFYDQIEMFRKNILKIQINYNSKFLRYQVIHTKESKSFMRELKGYIDNYSKDIEKLESLAISFGHNKSCYELFKNGKEHIVNVDKDQAQLRAELDMFINKYSFRFCEITSDIRASIIKGSYKK